MCSHTGIDINHIQRELSTSAETSLVSKVIAKVGEVMESAMPDAMSLLSELEPKSVRRLPAVRIEAVESSSSSPLGATIRTAY